MSKLKRICDLLFHANVIKTIIFNFRMLPKEQAIRLPIWLYGRVDIGECTEGGKIVFSSQQKPHFGGWKIGNYMIGQHYYHPLITLLCVRGTLYLGERGEIRNGNQIIIHPNAILTISSNVIIGAYSKIYCYKGINIKDNVRISWNVQLFDTNFHYYIENDNTIKRNMKNISIGTHCWIGNHVTISKGSIGDYCIVASNSVLTKDWSLINHTIFAGIPARALKTIQTRIFDYDIEEYLNNLFNTQKDLDYVETYQLPFKKIE